MLAANWIAPPTASPWDAQVRALAPRGGVAPGELLCGIAIVFDAWHRPRCTDEPKYSQLSREIRIRRRALDDFFERLRAGTARVALLTDHEPDTELCSTDDGSLKLWRTASALLFRVDDATRGGRTAIRAAQRLRSHRQVSAGSMITRCVGWDDPERRVTVTKLDLEELSLVPEGACPGVCAVVV